MSDNRNSTELITANFLEYGLDWHTFKDYRISENWIIERDTKAGVPGVRGVISGTSIKYNGHHAFDKPKASTFDGEQKCWECIIKRIDDEIGFYEMLKKDAEQKLKEFLEKTKK